MKHLILTAALASTALLAACGQPAGKAAAPAAEPVAAEAPMAEMAPAATAATTGHGTGVVTAIDPAAGTVTLDHGPIPELGWPAMTMSFKATPALLTTVKTGDRVKFALVMTDGAAEITAISPE
ncbi:copper-binding protein [Brevundimonas sp.]|jgi:Cu(I)/Ag(I) efflux system protein CusF|uniref:copper-binding protein n=1 Tax=Brevundimonas sp. TaxID=1871086 RepID=UPI0025BDF3FA|nr:copper-binding protein [Brevundimonas sp.]